MLMSLMAESAIALARKPIRAIGYRMSSIAQSMGMDRAMVKVSAGQGGDLTSTGPKFWSLYCYTICNTVCHTQIY